MGTFGLSQELHPGIAGLMKDTLAFSGGFGEIKLGDFDRLLGVKATAQDLTGGIAAVGLAGQMASKNAPLMESLWRFASEARATADSDSVGPEVPRDLFFQKQLRHWLDRLPASNRLNLFFAAVGLLQAIEAELDAAQSNGFGDSATLHLYAAMAIVAFVWAVAEGQRRS
jgi:hypothetical protein